MGFRFLLPLALAALLSACSDGQGASETRSGPPCPSNLQDVAVQVFQQSCIDAGCHGSADRAGGLDLETADLEVQLFGHEALLCGGEVRVVPGDAASSHLIAKLRGTSDCGAPMPPIGDPLDPATVDCMASWIDALDPVTTCESCLCVDLMSSFEKTYFIPDGAGKRPLFIAEQLAFKKGFRDAPAIDYNKRLIRAIALHVYGARYKLLAGAAFAGDQYIASC